MWKQANLSYTCVKSVYQLDMGEGITRAAYGGQHIRLAAF